METSAIIGEWRKTLQGERPSLSIEITRECPLRPPGRYPCDDAHLEGGTTLRGLRDRKGQELINGIIETVERLKPMHLSMVGGDPLVRYPKLEVVVPLLLDRGLHLQVVTSAFRRLPPAWVKLSRLSIVVSIDGLRGEHDLRRAPATYDRILKNIAGQKMTVHCTITGQMMKRAGYLKEFMEFWSPRKEVRRIWFSRFTPQVGDLLPEILQPQERRQAIADIRVLRKVFPKLDMAEGLIQQFAKPPCSPRDCVFALTPHTLSADLNTKIVPSQFGGNPDCGSCGCVASMAVIAAHRLGGIIPVGVIFKASLRIGKIGLARAGQTSEPQAVDEEPKGTFSNYQELVRGSP
jgi:hypothetical protein